MVIKDMLNDGNDEDESLIQERGRDPIDRN